MSPISSIPIGPWKFDLRREADGSAAKRMGPKLRLSRLVRDTPKSRFPCRLPLKANKGDYQEKDAYGPGGLSKKDTHGP